MGERFDLDAAMAQKREGLGSAWSKQKKMTVGGVCAVVAVGAVSAGVFAMIANTPPNMPKTAEEAVRVMGSDKFDLLDKDRRGQYAAEAGRLLGGLDDDARRELLRGRENREAMRNMMMEAMDQNARRMAKGEEMVWPDFGWGRRGGGGEGREEWRRRQEEMTDEEREARRKERQERMNQMLRDQIGSGNSQDSALRGEMFQQMMRGGGGFGGRRGGGGGGGGGGRGSGGGGGGGHGADA